MKILVSNDDGVSSPGLTTLAWALRKVGEVYVVAPDRERTAAGHSLTLHKPLRVTEVGERTFAVNGTPTDCVNLGVMTLMPERPQLVVSGINQGENLGDDITYSGTVSAAMEAVLLGIPSFAVSQVGESDFHFEAAAEFAVRLARLVIEHGLDEHTLLNVNVPNLPLEEIRGARFTCLGRRIYDQNSIIEKVDPRGKKYYWIAGSRLSWRASGNANADYEAIQRNEVSVTPIRLDLTDHHALERLSSWERGLNGDRPGRDAE